MANFIFTFMLFFIIPVSYARIRLQILPGNAIIGAAVLRNSEVDPIIRLPLGADNAESQLAEKLPEKEIGNNEIAEKLTVKDFGNNEIAVKLPVKEIGNNEISGKLTEKEIENNEIGETLPVNDFITNEVVEKLAEKEIGNNKVAKKLAEKEIGKNELVEKLPEIESQFNDFAELFDMMLPEVKTGDNELAEKLPETETNNYEINEKSSDSETGTVKSVPLRIARFRPVNHHARLKWRRSPRPCHHLYHPHHHLFPYNGDMLIPSGENGDFDSVIINHHRFHRIPSRWMSLPNLRHRHDHNDEDHDNNDDESKSLFKRSARFGKEKLRKHFHHDDHEDEDEEDKSSRFNGEVKIHEHDHKEKGLLHRIRKMIIF